MRRRHHIPSLDGLRGLSIILVLMGHSYLAAFHRPPTLNSVMLFLANSHIGVMTFFVISGYLITHLLREEWSAKQSIDLQGFYLRRSFKIFPTFYFYLFVVTLLTLLGVTHISSAALLCAATFSLNYGFLWSDLGLGTTGYWFIRHFWTLCLEEQFYLLWPLLLSKTGIPSGKRVAALILLLCPFVRIATYFLWPGLRAQIAVMLHTSADPLMMGCLIALYEGEPILETLVKRLSNGLLAGLAALIVFVLSPVLFAAFEGKYLYSVGMMVEESAIAFILLYLVHYPQSIAGRLFNSKILVSIGVLSYSLYIWQQLFLFPFHKTWAGGFPMNLLLAIVAGVASHLLIERPFLRLKSRLRERTELLKEVSVQRN